KAALLNQIPEATQTELQIVTRLIEQRDYVEATRQVIQIIEVNKEAARMAFDEFPNSTAALPIITPVFARFLPGGSLNTAPTLVTQIERVDVVEEPLAEQRARTMSELFRDRLLQTVLAGALISIAGYLIFEEKFIGNVQDVAGIFFWAFGIDITVDALLQTARGFKKT